MQLSRKLVQIRERAMELRHDSKWQLTKDQWSDLKARTALQVHESKGYQVILLGMFELTVNCLQFALHFAAL